MPDVEHAPFQHLCDLADVRGLKVGITVSTLKRNARGENYRDLGTLMLYSAERRQQVLRSEAIIDGDVDDAARRLIDRRPALQ